jgi:hypothetical protein
MYYILYKENLHSLFFCLNIQNIQYKINIKQKCRIIQKLMI